MQQNRELVRPAEYARSRGLNRSTVSRQIRDGKLTTVDGLLDPAAADAARANNLNSIRRDEAERRKQQAMGRAAGPAPSAGDGLGESDFVARGSVPRGQGGVPPTRPPVPVAPARGPLRFPEPPPKGTMAYAQLQHELAKAARAALEAQRLEGRLVDYQTVQQEWTSIAAAFRNAALSLPSRIVNRVPSEWHRTLTLVVEEEVRAMLTALSDEVRAAQ